MTLDRSKVSVIHVARQRLGLTEEDYRALLENYGGARSSKDLSDAGFESVMFRFKELGFDSTWSRANFGYRPAMATPKQVAYIRGLWRDYTDGRGTDASLGKLLERLFKVSSLRFLPKEDAPKAIGALRAMIGRRGKADAA